jgi:hypothetical protein
MAGSFSDYMESGILSHIFRTNTFNKPTTIAIALCSNVPVDADTGALSTGKEVANAGSYSRQVLATGDANWNFTFTNGSGNVTNASQISFTAATADWGWVSGVAICDSSSYGGGNFIIGGALALPKLVSNGDQLILKAADISLFLD